MPARRHNADNSIDDRFALICSGSVAICVRFELDVEYVVQGGRGHSGAQQGASIGATESWDVPCQPKHPIGRMVTVCLGLSTFVSSKICPCRTELQMGTRFLAFKWNPEHTRSCKKGTDALHACRLDMDGGAGWREVPAAVWQRPVLTQSLACSGLTIAGSHALKQGIGKQNGHPGARYFP